jgi:hypothetical protein
VLYEDVLGESEIRVLMAKLDGASQVKESAPVGWGGDRYRAYRTPAGPALVWYVVWDEGASAERFTARYGSKLRNTARKGYRARFETLELEGKPATSYVLAPEGWTGWNAVPHPNLVR